MKVGAPPKPTNRNGYRFYPDIKEKEITAVSTELFHETKRGKITQDQFAAVSEYKADAYSPINHYLRNGKVRRDYAFLPKASIQKHVDGLDSYLSNATLKKPLIVYRGVSLKTASELESVPNGTIVNHPAYVSTSIDRDAAMEFAGSEDRLMEIRLPKGTTAAPIQSGPWDNEAEVLLARGSAFKKIDKNVYEWVPQKRKRGKTVTRFTSGFPTVDFSSEARGLNQQEKKEQVGTSVSGRPLYMGDDGMPYSERTVTFEMPGGKWITFPSVDERGNDLPQSEIEDWVEENGPVDPITEEEFPVFDSREEAERYAVARSASRAQDGEVSIGDIFAGDRE